MRQLFPLLALCLLVALVGCDKPKDASESSSAASGEPEANAAGSSTTEESVEESTAHPARIAANKILAAIVDQDAAAIKLLLNKTNQEKVSDDDIAGMLKETKAIIGDVREVSELRKGRGDDEVLGKVLVADDEVFVVVLTKEDGKYLFEDLNSPDVESYEAMEKIEG